MTNLIFRGIYFCLACNIEAFFILYNYAFSPESQWWKILTYLLAVFTTLTIFYCSIEFYKRVIVRYLFDINVSYYRPPRRLKVWGIILVSVCLLYFIISIAYCAYELHVNNRLIDVLIMSIQGGLFLCITVYHVLLSLYYYKKGDREIGIFENLFPHYEGHFTSVY